MVGDGIYRWADWGLGFILAWQGLGTLAEIKDEGSMSREMGWIS